MGEKLCPLTKALNFKEIIFLREVPNPYNILNILLHNACTVTFTSADICVKIYLSGQLFNGSKTENAALSIAPANTSHIFNTFI